MRRRGDRPHRLGWGDCEDHRQAEVGRAGEEVREVRPDQEDLAGGSLVALPQGGRLPDTERKEEGGLSQEGGQVRPHQDGVGDPTEGGGPGCRQGEALPLREDGRLSSWRVKKERMTPRVKPPNTNNVTLHRFYQKKRGGPNFPFSPHPYRSISVPRPSRLVEFFLLSPLVAKPPPSAAILQLLLP